MIASQASRRAIIAGAGMLVATAAIPLAAGVQKPANRGNPKIRKAIALYERLSAACAAHDKEVQEPVSRAIEADIAALPRESEPPHVLSATSFINAFGDEHRFSTADVHSLPSIRRHRDDPTWMGDVDERWSKAACEIADAADARDAIISEQSARHDEAKRAIRSSRRFDDIYARGEALERRYLIAFDAVIETPAANLADVVLKLDFVDRTGGSDGSTWIADAIAADIRRLAGEGVA